MGDSSDFDRFFEEEYESVVYTVISVVGDRAEAESISQDAFVKALERWRRVREYDKPGAWVRRVAIRDAVRAQGRSVRSTPLGTADVAVEPRFVDDDVELDVALVSLSPRQRACVLLRHVDGWTSDEIGEALGCSGSTVRVHLHRGLSALSRQLESPRREEAADGR